ncbi:uncharacterized protein LOC127867067 [Dreissena polymorpha]|uniref:Uncharacterized protein n=1 Tax=Dreissena polymorpha TaxID=45954 RepID=A0A9D4REM7_DREPO|nr:uncharacterized protein LOC127867067 [Dreissena polymorpha]XP_052263973.1 uncharacterized protein LOC127867067 [Dreissena polymorpha]XP_052263974.1 uncharacterized protein LOC127867067 [Dreissena polymorpha]KAH3865484.1 hypothetical protein DPMN_028523 [Dreissena polymorpha]
MTTDLKNIYKAILRCVLKDQIQLLVHQLSEHTGDETAVITANVTERCHGNLGSTPGNKFLQQNTCFKEQFLNFCLGHHDGSSRFAHHPPSQSPGNLSAQIASKLKPDKGKTTTRSGPYSKKTTRRQLKPKPQAKPHEAKGHMFENKSEVGQIVNVPVNENTVKVNVSSTVSQDQGKGQGHEAEGRGHDVDNDRELTESTGSPLMDAADQLAVPMTTNSSAAARNSKRKAAVPFRRYHDPYDLGATALSSNQSRDTNESVSQPRATTISSSQSRDTTMSSSHSGDTTLSYNYTLDSSLSTTHSKNSTQLYSDTRATTLFPSNVSASTLFPGNVSAINLSSSYSSSTTLPSINSGAPTLSTSILRVPAPLPSNTKSSTESTNDARAVTLPPGYIQQISSPSSLLGTIELKTEPEGILDLSTTETREVIQSPGYIKLNYIPCPAMGVIVPKLEPLYTTEMSTDDETTSASSLGRIQRNSIRGAPPMATMELKVTPETSSMLLPVYRESIFPEQSPSSMSSPSRSQQSSGDSTPQESNYPDGRLVSRGDERFEKLIDCEICGKMCRTSNMARHRKRYCLLSTSRHELLEDNSPGVQGFCSESEENSWSIYGGKGLQEKSQ